MITNKSKIQYEIIVNNKEREKIRDMYFEKGYKLYECYWEFMVFRPESIRWSILFTRKQYELFKRLWNETKNKK